MLVPTVVVLILLWASMHFGLPIIIGAFLSMLLAFMIVSWLLGGSTGGTPWDR